MVRRASLALRQAQGAEWNRSTSRRIALVQGTEDHGVYSVDEWAVRPSEARTNKSNKGPRTSVRGVPVGVKLRHCFFKRFHFKFLEIEL